MAFFTTTWDPSVSSAHKPVKLALALAVAIGLLIAFVIATGILGHKSRTLSTEVESIKHELHNVQQTLDNYIDKQPLCRTRECVVSAASILESIDPAIDPCQDFYQFACGGWMLKSEIPASALQWGRFDELRDMVVNTLKEILTETSNVSDSRAINKTRILYDACTSTDDLEAKGVGPLIALLKTYGGWPMIMDDWSEVNFTWMHNAAKIRANLGQSYLIDVHNYLDSNNTEHSTIYIDQPSLGLSASIFLKNHNNAVVRKAYTSLISEMAKALRDSPISNVTTQKIEDEANEIVAFEIELAKIQTRKEAQRNLTRAYNPMTIEELQNWSDQINTTNPSSKIRWLEYLRTIYQSADVTDINSNETITLVEPDYLKKLIRLIDKTPAKTLANYMSWCLCVRFNSDTNEFMNLLLLKFNQVLGTTSSPPRWAICLNRVTKLMGFALGAAFVTRTLNPQVKSEAIDMIKNLHSGFRQTLNDSEWMDTETKDAAIEKIEAMKQYVAYPNWILNATLLDEYYDRVELEIMEHFKNVIDLTTFLTHKDLRLLRQPVDPSMWEIPPITVNAFYILLSNSIYYPAGILQPPFFQTGRLAAINYGSMGTMIGHEMAHGFDDVGRQANKDGRVESWWSNRTLDAYLERAKCFEEQYSNYTLPEFFGTEAYNVNGAITLGENIADNVGVKEAFRAYKLYKSEHGIERRLPGLEQYTAEQLFFLSYAQSWCTKTTPQGLMQQILNSLHSPERYRVNGALSNSPEFAETFKCPIGTMNRLIKCTLW